MLASTACLIWMVSTGMQASPRGDYSGAREERIVERVNQFYQAYRGKKYDEALDMWAPKYRDDEKRLKESLKVMRKTGRSVKVKTWRIVEILVAGDIAKVSVEMQVHAREGFFEWKDLTEAQTKFWEFENGDWYFTPYKLFDWDDTKATRLNLPLQTQPSPRVDVKTKD